MRARIIGKIVAFLACSALIVVFFSILFTPVFDSIHGKNSSTIRGLYNQPENSVQVAFFGTSSMLAGMAPVQLYEETGVSSYNCATRAQPLIVTYFLIREMHRLNPDSLKTVVIDPVKVIETSEESSRAKQSFLLMNNSMIKLQAIWESSQYYDNFSFLENLIPLLGYHSRWSTLSEKDYRMFALGDSSLDFSSHGYFARYGSTMDQEKLNNWINRGDVSDTLDYNPAEFEAIYDKGKEYLDRIVEYCKDNDLELVFVKVPRLRWSDYSHDVIQHLANEYGVEFVDMNTLAALNEMGLDFRNDMIDHAHANVTGASKFTHYVAEHLSCFANKSQDGSQAKSEAFSQSDFDARVKELEDAELFSCQNLVDYLQLLERTRYVTFIATQGTQVDLDSSIQEVLKEQRLEKLASLKAGEYYIGIISKGRGIRGIVSTVSDETAFRGSFDGNKLTLGTRKMQPKAQLDNKFDLLSGDEAVISVLEEDHCIKHDGINFVVYDTETGELIDSSCFSLTAPYTRFVHEITSVEVL